LQRDNKEYEKERGKSETADLNYPDKTNVPIRWRFNMSLAEPRAPPKDENNNNDCDPEIEEWPPKPKSEIDGATVDKNNNNNENESGFYQLLKSLGLSSLMNVFEQQ